MNLVDIATDTFPLTSTTPGEVETPLTEGTETWGDEEFFRIPDCERMPPFLTYVVSDSDGWMFAASNGALTAGRGNPDRALFPYCTQDKLFDLAGTVASLTAVHVFPAGGGRPFLWEPWMPHRAPSPDHVRSLLKNRSGSMLAYEEMLPHAGLRWRHSWSLGVRHGVIRRVELENLGSAPVVLRVLDGLQNLMPPGVDQAFQNQFSNLVDAYKKNELLQPSGIGVYYLSSVPTDRAEPNEGLTASVAWTTGLDVRTWLLSTAQVASFRRGGPIETETDVRGRRGAHLVETDMVLGPGERREWWMAADVGLDAVALADLRRRVESVPSAVPVLSEEARATSAALRRRVGQIDGLQVTADTLRCWRHFSNALFNCMRGGVFAHGYQIPTDDFLKRVRHSDRAAFERHQSWLRLLPALVDRAALLEMIDRRGDPDLSRIAGEYLPLTFSRRHGDPSRPWNRFSIETRDPDGRPRIAYQGNWRDIFQNWEALLFTYPEYADAVVARFLNASTADGYNPYRITERGFEWETIEPDEPWSNIGYWGDHQIVYLLKLLETSRAFHPGRLVRALDREIFVYADVPYRIAGYDEILRDPRNTVAYDGHAAAEIARRVERIGAAGLLLHAADGAPVRATLIEKLLVPLLAKLGNFVPDGGIWMNTQRPEWNDANNALVGYGISVVTLGYVHRYMTFLVELLAEAGRGARCGLAREVAQLMSSQHEAFRDAGPSLEAGFTSADRRRLMDRLGGSASNHRTAVYEKSLGREKHSVDCGEIASFLETALRFVRRTLRANRRQDGLYHSYNLLRIDDDGSIGVDHLDEMLEGQVSILSSGILAPGDAVSLCRALRTSRLYRKDQDSYLLQPDRTLPSFLEKNRIPEGAVAKSSLLGAMLARGDTRIVARGCDGHLRFHASFRNVGQLRAALAALPEPELRELAAREADVIAAAYEATFQHRSFTGRSGTFFAFEGLGSIYWHMVSKLALAVQENHRLAIETGAKDEVCLALASHYHEILAGLGWKKSAALYGAFPTDAYSHTPAHSGAQQPGMTGQVKEDLLSRWGELGVTIKSGRLSFVPRLLRRAEFLEEPTVFNTVGIDGAELAIDLPERAVAFTFCQVPVVYVLSNAAGIEIHARDGSVVRRDRPEIPERESASIFQRTGSILRVIVSVDESQLLP